MVLEERLSDLETDATMNRRLLFRVIFDLLKQLDNAQLRGEIEEALRKKKKGLL